MDHFDYRNGRLFAEEVELAAVAADYGTPCYVYSRATIERHWRAFDQALAGQDHLVCYAVKANSNLAVLNVMARLGSGFDIVSRGRTGAGAAGGRRSRQGGVFRGGQARRRDCAAPWRRGYTVSMWSRRGSWSGLTAWPANWGGARRCRCGSIPTWTPRPTPISPPASRRTSSASISPPRRNSMPTPPPCRISRSSAWIATSARS